MDMDSSSLLKFESVKIRDYVVLSTDMVIAKDVVLPAIAVGSTEISPNQLLKDMSDMKSFQGGNLCWLLASACSECF